MGFISEPKYNFPLCVPNVHQKILSGNASSAMDQGSLFKKTKQKLQNCSFKTGVRFRKIDHLFF